MGIIEAVKSIAKGIGFAFISIGALPFLVIKSFVEIFH
ncbi:hypothetical protein IJ22_05240 [Paenibacillus naphthalenovorans]|uniref:Uncharacterized protein n=1 Tax=Paenibacillus naphthalenovorans TaxID=162209 RepID=A0A0U2MU64_9BACL|nr:hypothetical protein IJ22_05240 [Paenibacillus naphthalenovorans]SDI58332.1 hypothetical protein SAMN05421868_10816 [Paenibacillus naphthalenovorans]